MGQSVRLSIRAEGTSPDYRWQRDRNQQLEPLDNGADFEGTTTASLCIKKATTDLSGEYLCRVQNELSYDDSHRVRLDVSKSSMMYPITRIHILCVHACTLYVNCNVQVVHKMVLPELTLIQQQCTVCLLITDTVFSGF